MQKPPELRHVPYNAVSHGSEASRSTSPMTFRAKIVINMTLAGTKLMLGGRRDR